MNLPFTRYISGKETYFPEKIIAGLDLPDFKKCTLNDIMAETIKPTGSQFMMGSCNPLHDHRPKFHTFRENLKGTWKPGVMIDFIFWSGRPYWSTPVRFAPRIPVVSVQKIEIKHIHGQVKRHQASVMIDGMVCSKDMIEEVSQNDGFDSLESFFAWFNKDFTGSIIHWTDLRY